MKNKHVRSRFLRWHEGKLSADERAIVDKHIAACAACHSYFRRMESVLSPPDADDLALLHADPFLPTRIRALVEAKQQRAMPSLQKSKWLNASGWALSGSLMVLAVVLGMYLGSGMVTTEDRYSEELIIEGFYEAFYLEDAGRTLESLFDLENSETQL